MTIEKVSGGNGVGLTIVMFVQWQIMQKNPKEKKTLSSK